VGGVTTMVKVGYMHLCHSRTMLVRDYPRETQEMVFDAYERTFCLLPLHHEDVPLLSARFEAFVMARWA